MPSDNFKKELSTKQVITLKSKPEMCGWALLQMAEDKRQSQLKSMTRKALDQANLIQETSSQDRSKVKRP